MPAVTRLPSPSKQNADVPSVTIRESQNSLRQEQARSAPKHLLPTSKVASVSVDVSRHPVRVPETISMRSRAGVGIEEREHDRSTPDSANASRVKASASKSAGVLPVTKADPRGMAVAGANHSRGQPTTSQLPKYGTIKPANATASRLQGPGFSTTKKLSDTESPTQSAQSTSRGTTRITVPQGSGNHMHRTTRQGKLSPANSTKSSTTPARLNNLPRPGLAAPAGVKGLRSPATPVKAPPTPATPRSRRHTTKAAESRHGITTSRQDPASSPLKASSNKPAFNTYQRSFSPTKLSQPQSAPAITSVSTANIRAETHLLHLSLLHQSAAPTLKAWTSSAHDQLLSLHQSLQMLYIHVMKLEQEARQAENMIALHQWAGGNMKSVGRRLNVLCGVLKEVMMLTAPGGRDMPVSTKIDERKDDDEQSAKQRGNEEDADFFWENEPEPVEEQQGEYTRLIEAFTSWTNWVQEIWRDRDKEISDEVYTPTPAGSSQPQASADAITPIDPLGDSLKSSLRTLTNTVSSLQLHLDELPDFPPSAQTLETTPVSVLKLAREMIAGMKEELQLIREIEFEVVVGEEAWLKQRLSSLSGEVERGFATPLRR